MNPYSSGKSFFSKKLSSPSKAFVRSIFQTVAKQLPEPLNSKDYLERLELAFVDYFELHHVLKKFPTSLREQEQLRKVIIEELLGTIEYYGLTSAHYFIEDIINVVINE